MGRGVSTLRVVERQPRPRDVFFGGVGFGGVACDGGIEHGNFNFLLCTSRESNEKGIVPDRSLARYSRDTMNWAVLSQLKSELSLLHL